VVKIQLNIAFKVGQEDNRAFATYLVYEIAHAHLNRGKQSSGAGMDLYDSSGNRVGSIGGGLDLGGCLTTLVGLMIISTVVKAISPFWATLRGHGIHPVFIIALFSVVIVAVLFIIGWILRFAIIRAMMAVSVVAAAGYGIFYWITGVADWIWAGAGLAIFGVFAVRFVKWAYSLDGDLSEVFFL
jgi:CBS domain containing-hemolysin-like protein